MNTVLSNFIDWCDLDVNLLCDLLCDLFNLNLNTSKTKELVTDFRSNTASGDSGKDGIV